MWLRLYTCRSSYVSFGIFLIYCKNRQKIVYVRTRKENRIMKKGYWTNYGYKGLTMFGWILFESEKAYEEFMEE